MKGHSLLKAILLSAACYAGSTILGPTYVNVDNVTVALVTNGCFGQSVFCQYLHPLFCILVYRLSTLVPSADMFTVLVHFLIVLELLFLSWLGFKKLTDGHKSGIENVLSSVTVILCIVFYSFCIRLWNANYTIQTASFVFTGMLGIFHGKGKVSPVLGTFFISLGFLMRNAGALLFVPYFFLETLVLILDPVSEKGVQERKFRVRAEEAVKRILPCICIVSALLLSQAVFYSTEPYATDQLYSEARTTIVDFPMKSWSSVREVFADDPEIDEAEYDAVKHWILADTDIMDADNLKRIADAGSKNRYSFSAEGIVSALRDMRKRVMDSDVQLFMLIILIAVFLFRILLSSASGIRKAEAVLAVAGTFVILLYFTIRGRALTHVWFCVLLAAGSILTPLALGLSSYNRSETIRNDLGLLIICAILYFSIGQEIQQTDIHWPRTPLTARAAEGEAKYRETFHDDAIYVWPNWQSELRAVFRETDRLPSRQFLEHNIAMGDWTYGQLYYREYLERLGVNNPATSGLNGQNVYYMNINNSAFLKYMKSHYGEDIEAVEAGTVHGNKAYKLVHSEGVSTQHNSDTRIDLTILMPCLNEENNIAYSIDEAQKYIQRRNLSGEILVADNASTDQSAEIAKAHGARVVYESRPGYGRALRTGLSSAAGDVIIFGDCDSTYDFSDLDSIYLPLAENRYDFITGDRFAGQMENGAMSWSHKLGVPFLSLCGRMKFGVKIHDWHCGIRGIRKDALQKCRFRTTGMEFATEMIAEAGRKSLRIGEVSVPLRKAKKERKEKLRTIRDGLRHLWYIARG